MVSGGTGTPAFGPAARTPFAIHNSQFTISGLHLVPNGTRITAIFEEAPAAMITTRRIVRTLGGPRVVKASTLDDLRARRRSGLPYASLDAVSAAYRIAAKDLGKILDLPPRTLARRKKERRLHPDESDRPVRLRRGGGPAGGRPC